MCEPQEGANTRTSGDKHLLIELKATSIESNIYYSFDLFFQIKAKFCLYFETLITGEFCIDFIAIYFHILI